MGALRRRLLCPHTQDLQRIAVLGSGAFGQVMLVKHEGKYMALKTLSKQQIVEMGLQVHHAPPQHVHAPNRHTRTTSVTRRL